MSIPPLLQGKLRIPLIGAPLFIVSGPELVIAQCKAGIVGAFPALNARPQSQLDEWIKQIKSELASFAADHPNQIVAPFAVNQIVHTSNNRLHADLDTCIRHKVPIIITSLRPPSEVVTAVHEYGGVVFHDVINMRHARKAMEQGVDGIIAVCAGAGGHAGALSPFALIKEIRKEFGGAIILSGCMSTGADILAAQVLGADLAYLGTRFIASKEANATDAYKQMIVESNAQDIVYTSFFSGVPGSYLKASIENAGFDPENLAVKDSSAMDFGNVKESDVKAWRDIWSAGQGVGNIDAVLSVDNLVNVMVKEYKEARDKLNRN